MRQSNPQPVCPVSPALPEALTTAKALPVKTGLQAGGCCDYLEEDFSRMMCKKNRPDCA